VHLGRGVQQVHEQPHGKDPRKARPPVSQQQRQQGKQHRLGGEGHGQGPEAAPLPQPAGDEIAGGAARSHHQQQRAHRPRVSVRIGER